MDGGFCDRHESGAFFRLTLRETVSIDFETDRGGRGEIGAKAAPSRAPEEAFEA